MDESIAISGNLSRVKIGETVYMGRNISRDLSDRINERAEELAKYDLTESEILFQIMKEFANGSHHDLAREDWGDTNGEYDEAGNQTNSVVDTGKPSGYLGDDTNWTATGAKINSEPYPTNLEPAINQRNIPEESYFPEVPLYEARSNERHDMPDLLKKSNKDDQPYIPVRIINDDLEMEVPKNEQIEDLADEEGEPDKLYLETPELDETEDPITETDDDITWITVKGSHIPVKKGESNEVAISNFFHEKHKKRKADEKKTRDDNRRSKQDLMKYGLDKGKIKTLENNYMKSDLSITGKKFETHEITKSEYRKLMGNIGAVEYDMALRDSNHKEADKIFMNAIKKDSEKLNQFKKEMENVIAFNNVLKDKLDKATHVYRFVSFSELGNMVDDGVFENKYSDFKSFTVEKQSDYFSERDVTISVPTKDIKNELTPLEYTPFFRNTDYSNEKLGDSKNSEFASETEVRMKNNTKIPKGLSITINTSVSESKKKRIQERYGSLGKITFADEEWSP